MERVGNHDILNIWAISYHYEIHNEKEVLIQDAGFEIMQPIKVNLRREKSIRIDFPNNVSEGENDWEALYFSHFYQFEHLKLTDWSLKLEPMDNQMYEIRMKGYVTDDLSKKSENSFLEGALMAKLETKINSRFNWKYSRENPAALNR